MNSRPGSVSGVGSCRIAEVFEPVSKCRRLEDRIFEFSSRVKKSFVIARRSGYHDG